MGDLISRQAAINELMKMRSEHKGDTFHGDLLHWTGMKAMLEDLPPVDPIEYCERCMVEHVDAMEELEVKLAIAQPETGKWLPDNANYYDERHICSKCKRNFKVDICMGKPSWNFCPNCGADMRGA